MEISKNHYMYFAKDFPIDISCLAEIGDQTENAKRIVKELSLEVKDKEFLRSYLQEFGAWSEEELDIYEDNLFRLIWIIAYDIKESGCFIYSH